MPSNSQNRIQVPFKCPLPRYCPVCDEPASRTVKIRAFEGIPLVITFRIKVPVNYCERHYSDLRSLEIRQWLSVLVTPATLLIGIPMSNSPALETVFFTILAIALCFSLSSALYFGHRISRQRGLRISTQGGSGTFLVGSTNEGWFEKTKSNVSRYYE